MPSGFLCAVPVLLFSCFPCSQCRRSGSPQSVVRAWTTLSGGQQQRVAIARALIAKPDVIFADEPTGNLDSKSGGEVMELLQNVWKKMGKALVVITHDSRIARMADRQFQIVDGLLAEVTAK